MKLNSWQILGVGLIVIGVIFVIRNQMKSTPAADLPPTIPSISTQPAVTP